MKLLCSEAHIGDLVHALYVDWVPAVLMERTGSGWRVEFLRPEATACPAVQRLIDAGTVVRA
jgi:hypothetical protein